MQLRLPLCRVCWACKWERNKSNIDCRAVLPPAGDPQTCRPGLKSFSAPKLAWEEQGQPRYTPSTSTTYDLMMVVWTDTRIQRQRYTSGHTHHKNLTHNHPKIVITPVRNTLGCETHTDITLPLVHLECWTHSSFVQRPFTSSSPPHPSDYFSKLPL